MPAISFSQDILVKRDSSKIEAKVLEIRPNEIKYKYFNYQDGPVLVIDRNEIAYIIYPNGQSERFPLVLPQTNLNLPRIIENQRDDSTRTPAKIGDYIKLNLQVATVVYNSYCNLPRKGYYGMTSTDDYARASSKQNVTFNLGINLVLGKSPYIKHFIGVNYLRTKGEFYHDYSGIGYSSHAKYTSYVSYINFITGLRFTIAKKFHLEPAITVIAIQDSKTTRNGTEYRTDMQNYVSSHSSYENETVHRYVETTVAFSPKISYEIFSKKIKLEAYISYNMALYYRLPWYQFGFHIYPFKKLR
jgi:hypothetical protein